MQLQQEIDKVNAFCTKREADLKAEISGKLECEVEKYNKSAEQVQAVAAQYLQIVEASRKYVKEMDSLTKQITNRVIRKNKVVNLVDSM